MRIEYIISYLAAGSMGLCFFLTSVSTCKDPINGTFIEISLDNSFGVTKTWAIFEYQYNGKKYHGYAIDRLSGRTQKKLIPGEVYPLYIDPKNPRCFRCTKRIVMFQEIVLFFTGFSILLGVISSFFEDLISCLS